MKVAILAGGLGTRLGELTARIPKPMVEIGGRPILWHIMAYYAHYGYRDFVIALGYKGEIIKRYLADLCTLSGDLYIDLAHRTIARGAQEESDWRIWLVETGGATQTGGRIKRLGNWLGDETFMLTWGDGVSTVDLAALLAFHRAHGRLATVTAVRTPARFGRLDLKGDRVVRFTEKPPSEEEWINGAFFVLEPAVLDYIEGDHIQFEREPLEGLVQDGQLMAFQHDGFWQCMDTPRDKQRLEELWETGAAPWKVWESRP